jgi:hypothetical protein
MKPGGGILRQRVRCALLQGGEYAVSCEALERPNLGRGALSRTALLDVPLWNQLIFLFLTSQKGQFDSSLQEAEEGFLSFLWTAEGLDNMTAERTQFQQFTAAAPQAMDASVAHDFATVGALVRDARALMTRTNQSPIGKHHRWRWTRDLQFGDGNRHFSAFDKQIHIAETQDLPHFERSFTYRPGVDESAISGAAIADDNFVIGQSDLTVLGRYSSVLDDEVVAGGPADAIYTKIKVYNLVVESGRLNQQLGHISLYMTAL